MMEESLFAYPSSMMAAAAVMAMHREEVTDGGEDDAGKVKAMKLPEDVVYEIFSRLPAKSILKFKSCSKSINEFTKEKNFVGKHTQNLTLQGDSFFFIQERDGTKTEIYALPGSDKASSGILKSFLQLLNKMSVKIISSGCYRSSNGLLLCEVLPKIGLFFWQKPKRKIVICNPTTQSFSSIVVPPSYIGNYPRTHITMAFESNHNKGVHDQEYELLFFEQYIEQESEYIICKAYKPKEGVWKEREKGLVMGHRRMFFSCGTDGWCYHLLSYNFESGGIRKVRFPKGATKTNRFGRRMLHVESIGVYKWDKVGTSIDDICLVIWDKDNLVFTVWVLIDEELSSWSKFLRVSFGEMGLKNDFIVRGFAVMNGDSLVFATKRDVYWYDLIGERGRRRLEKIGGHRFNCELKFFSYSSTLWPCGAMVGDLAFIR